jgi:hypothetical protein
LAQRTGEGTRIVEFAGTEEDALGGDELEVHGV